MEKEQLKKILAGIGLAGLLTAAGATFPGSASAA
ncbi:MAG: selenobiotic family radical SAM modification target peptide [Nitrospirae bacterium]|nr:selenobiotic family radical SAM modification target peptide [Nitrospirota bacterium]